MEIIHKNREAFVEAEYDVFDERRKRQEALDADADDLAELERDAERIESQKS